MSENKLMMIGRGCNSELYAYGESENRVVLKVVSSFSKKEQRHLKNEYTILKTLDHENIIKALKYQENVAFQGNKIDK
jgi:serine/threonine protein kinase